MNKSGNKMDHISLLLPLIVPDYSKKNKQKKTKKTKQKQKKHCTTDLLSLIVHDYSKKKKT